MTVHYTKKLREFFGTQVLALLPTEDDNRRLTKCHYLSEIKLGVYNFVTWRCIIFIFQVQSTFKNIKFNFSYVDFIGNIYHRSNI